MKTLNKQRKIENGNWIPLIAIIVSVVSLLFTWFVDSKNNERWEESNIGKLKIKSIKTIDWKIYDEEVAKKINFGYPLVMQYRINQDSYTGKVSVPFSLILWDLKKDEAMAGANQFTTISEITQEAIRLGLTPSDALIMRKYNFMWEFENFGNSDLIINDLHIVMNTFDKQEVDYFRKTEPSKINPGQNMSIPKPIHLNLHYDLSKEFKFVVSIEYSSRKEKHLHYGLDVYWNPEKDFWRY